MPLPHKPMGTDALMKEINRVIGEDTITKGSDPRHQVVRLPTGFVPFDHLLDGGLPMGRSTEIFGDWSTLKTYIALSACASCQAMGRVAAVIDTEHAYDPEWARTIGVDTDTLILQHPETGEEALNAAEAMLRGGVGLLVWDSVASTLPMTEAAKSAQDKVQPARVAEFMSRGLRRLTAANGDTAMLWINQTRLNVGVTFGNPETTPGGRALPFYASYRVGIRKGKRHRDDDRNTVAQEYVATVEKSKLSIPHAQVTWRWDLEAGRLDLEDWLVTMGLRMGLVTTSGSYYTVEGPDGPVKARGRKGVMKALRKDPLLARTLQDKIMAGKP